MASARAGKSTDILIVGGSFTGMIAAAALAEYGFKVTIVDRRDPEVTRKAGADGRTTALSHASTNLMTAVGLWDKIAPHACPIHDIRVSDGDAPVFLHYDHAEIGEAPLGHIVENWHLWNETYAHVTGLKGVTYRAPATVDSLERDTYRASAVFDDATLPLHRERLVPVAIRST